MTYTFCGNEVNVKRIKNDVNGNPRYVIHFLTVFYHPVAKAYKDVKNTSNVFYDVGYDIACTIANNAGFKRYHNKMYGGGLVFQSYDVQESLNALESAIENYFDSFYFVEVTDTFGGECNYCWLRRYMVQAKNQRAAMLKVAKHEGYSVKYDGNMFLGKHACIAIYCTDNGDFEDYKEI